MPKPNPRPTDPPGGQPIEFQYVQSNLSRVIHVDGVWGGVTPHLDILMVVFSEHQRFPNRATHFIGPDGALGEQVGKPTKRVITRTVEAELVISLITAKSFRDWLDEKVKEGEKAVTEMAQRRQTRGDGGEGIADSEGANA